MKIDLILIPLGFLAIASSGLVFAEDDPKKFSGLVACRAVDVEAKVVEGKSGSKKVEMSLTEDTQLLEHRVAKLSDLSGKSVWVLAARQAPQTIPGSTAKTELSIVRVLAIVEGDAFDPPPVTESQKKSYRGWQRGKLEQQGGQIRLDGTLMQVGSEFKVLRLIERTLAEVTEGKRPTLRKGVALKVEGEHVLPATGEGDKTPPKKRKGPVQVELAELQVLAKDYPKKNYAIVWGTAK